MNGYEKIIKVMRKQGKNNLGEMKIGVMLSESSIALGSLVLDKDDLLFSSHLITGFLDCDSKPVPPLKSGDKVLIKKISDEKFVVIERVTEFA